SGSSPLPNSAPGGAAKENLTVGGGGGGCSRRCLATTTASAPTTITDDAIARVRFGLTLALIFSLSCHPGASSCPLPPPPLYMIPVSHASGASGIHRPSPRHRRRGEQRARR